MQIHLETCSNADLQRLVRSACDAIQDRRLLRPAVAIVLGSGLGALAEEILHATSIEYSEIPGFSKTHVAGHAGRLILGFIGGLPVVLMQGRTHRYEGHSQRKVQFPVQVMRGLGAETLIVTNAAGGLNRRFDVGDLMVIDSHIDFLWSRGQYPPPESRSVARGHNPYSPELIRRAKAIALRKEIVLHQGCYLGTLGPTYETRSEYRFFRTAGADAVGMSTIGEVLAARDLAMRVLGFSVITNVASTEVPTTTSHQEVEHYAQSAGPRLLSIVKQLLDEISGQPD